MGLLSTLGVESPFGSLGQGDGTMTNAFQRLLGTTDTGAGPAGGEAALGGTPSAAPVPPAQSEIGSKAMQFFMGKGLSPEQAAGLAGNFAWESGGKHDTVSPNDNLKNSPNSPHSAGIGQWNDRLPALIEHARAGGVDVPHGNLRSSGDVRRMIGAIPLDKQLEFAWKELNSTEGRSLKGLRDAQDPQSATAAAIGYHRPAGWTTSNPTAGHGFAQRLGLAQGLLAQNAAPIPGGDPLGAPPPATPNASPMDGAIAGGPLPVMGAPQLPPAPRTMGREPRQPVPKQDPEDASKLLEQITKNFVRPEAPKLRPSYGSGRRNPMGAI